MANQLDFLKEQKVADLLIRKRLRLFRVGSLVGLVCYTLIVAATLSYSFFLQRQGQSIDRQIEVKKTKIVALKKIESLQVLLDQRLTFLDKVLINKRIPYAKLLGYFSDNLLAGIFLKEVKFLALGEIKVDGTASNVVALSRYLENINLPNQGMFSGVKVTSVNRQKDGSYFFNLLFKANEESEEL